MVPSPMKSIWMDISASFEKIFFILVISEEKGKTMFGVTYSFVVSPAFVDR